MAYFAKVKEDNVVDIVVAIPDEFEVEPTEYLTKYWGEDGNWIKTSFTNSIRGVFAKTGYTYDPVADIFIASEETATE